MHRPLAKPRNAASEISFPARLLVASLLLTALMICGLSYCAIAGYNGMATASARYARSADLQGMIVHLDEVLTMSAKMAAATGDLGWEKRYRANQSDLDNAIQATMKNSPPSAVQSTQLNAANLQLVAMESRAFDEVARGNKDRARALLEGPQYGQQKQFYAAAISGYINSAREEERATLQWRRRQGTAIMLAGLVGMIGLSLTWLGAVRKLRDWRDANLGEIEAKRVQLHAAQARYERTATNVPGMVFQFVLKPDGATDMPFVSEGARDMYGIEPRSIRADSNLILDAVIAQDRPILDESIVRSARDLAPWRWEGRIDLPDGERKWISGVARPEKLANGDVSWDGVLIDITQSKVHEADLNHARQEAEAANRAKSEFLSRMSHELRTPLNAILGFGQLLEVEDLSEDQEQSIEQIMVAGEHLLSLINEVLDIARIESGQQELQLECIDAEELAREICKMVRPLAQQNEISLDLCFGDDALDLAPKCFIADPQRAKQILINLLSNAVKYAGVGAKVWVSCQRTTSDLGTPQVALSVRDNGPGIALELQERVWTPFDRLGAEARKIEGAGVGLALARELARAMNGTLELRSAPGQGCTFVLALPCAGFSDRN